MIVHYLQHGRPLCLFSEGMPVDWPLGHSWIHIERKLSAKELKKNNAEMCERCVKKKEGIKK